MSSSCATVFPAGWARRLCMTAAVLRDIRGLTKDACGWKESTGHPPDDDVETKTDDDKTAPDVAGPENRCPYC